MQNLTEQKILYREAAFFDLIENLIPDYYNIPDDYEMTEEDAYITSIILDHFIENYKQLNISEELYLEKYDIDINQPLYDEVVSFILDESIGKFVAGAYHALKRVKDKAKYEFSKGYAASLKNRESAAKKAMASAKTQQTKAASATGVKGEFKKGLTQARAEKATRKFEKLQAAHGSARATRDMLKNPLKASKSKQDADKAKLASKIDTGITNIKKKATDKIKSGVNRLGSAIGRFA